MGNCSFKGETDAAKGYNLIRIMRDSGEILELKGPKFVGDILSAFPGYNIFCQGHISSPLFDHEQLLEGHLYYLLPSKGPVRCTKLSLYENFGKGSDPKLVQDIDHVSRDIDAESISEKEPVRRSSSAASLDLVMTSLANGSGLEVLPSPRKGVWRVKLVMNPKQLEEILSEEVNMEALIEQMRIAASSAAIAKPKQTKSYWGVSWRPRIPYVFKLPCENHTKVQSLDI